MVTANLLIESADTLGNRFSGSQTEAFRNTGQHRTGGVTNRDGQLILREPGQPVNRSVVRRILRLYSLRGSPHRHARDIVLAQSFRNRSEDAKTLVYRRPGREKNIG